MTINLKTKSGYELRAFPKKDIYMIANDANSDEWHVTIRITRGMGLVMQNEMWQVPYNEEEVDRNT